MNEYDLKTAEEIMTSIDILEDLLTGYIAGATGRVLASSKKNEKYLYDLFNDIPVNMEKKDLFYLIKTKYLDKDWNYE